MKMLLLGSISASRAATFPLLALERQGNSAPWLFRANKSMSGDPGPQLSQQLRFYLYETFISITIAM